MLQKQIEVWNSYQGLPVRIILVDDGSQKHPTSKLDCRIPVDVYRIKQDIPWNVAGARNLGCSQAEGWILCCDIDTLIYREDLEKLVNLNPDCFYIPSQVSLPEGHKLTGRVNVVLFHKSKFVWYDEDYSGHYGREVLDFYLRMTRVAKPVHLNVRARVMPRWMIADASTSLDRDHSRNTAMFIQKRKANFPRVTEVLRFEWERV